MYLQPNNRGIGNSKRFLHTTTPLTSGKSVMKVKYENLVNLIPPSSREVGPFGLSGEFIDLFKFNAKRAPL